MFRTTLASFVMLHACFALERPAWNAPSAPPTMGQVTSCLMAPLNVSILVLMVSTQMPPVTNVSFVTLIVKLVTTLPRTV